MTMAEHKKTPVKPGRASTVILARQHRTGLQVYLLRRSSKSNFMPGNYVFPGGKVEEEDWFSEQLKERASVNGADIFLGSGGGLNREEAMAYGVAAIRETYEEAGVLLGKKNEQGSFDPDGHSNRFLDEGLARGWFREKVASEGCIPTFSSLGRWAHWITPRIMPRRYDTRFFLAIMPGDQECAPDTRETTYGIWVTPQMGLSGNLRGEYPLSPPTVVTLHELLQFNDVGDLEKELASREWGQPRMPRVVPSGDDVQIILPWDPLYFEDGDISTKLPEEAVLPVGEPFSRLWNHENVWRPISG